MERVVSQRPGIELEHAPDGKAGLALAVSCRPDLVLLDMHLPDMSGEDIVQYLWADPRTRDIPVVVVTADASPGLARRLKAAGATSCVTKPINVRGVLELIDNLLNGQGRREVDAEPTAPSQASATRH
jgi:CheY-like chemotaxis protein